MWGGTRLEQLDDAEVVRKALHSLACVFGKKVPQPVRSVISRWGNNEFVRGAYSYVACGATGVHYDDLSRPVDAKLYFAGEATSRWNPATATGAYLSGLKAAYLIDSSLRLGGGQKARASH